jgi:hypothetical protein
MAGNRVRGVVKTDAKAPDAAAPSTDEAAPAGDAPVKEKKPRKPRAVDTQENITAVIDAFMGVQDQLASLEIFYDEYKTTGNDGNKLRDFMKTHRAALTALAGLDALVVKVVNKNFLQAFVEKTKAIRAAVMAMHDGVVESF